MRFWWLDYAVLITQHKRVHINKCFNNITKNILIEQVLCKKVMFVADLSIKYVKYIVFCRDLRDKKMAGKLMYITNNDTQNYPFYRLK